MSCCSPTPPSENKPNTSGCCGSEPVVSSCCAPAAPKVTSCCGSGPQTVASSQGGCCDTPAPRDYLLWGGMGLVACLYLLHFVSLPLAPLAHAAHSVFELINTMAWGVAVGVVMVAVLARVPREWVMAVMGTHSGFKGLLRATAAGVMLDLCSHGILMVGAKLYERGASLGQVMAFLIASPWNSFSLTLILVALIGLSWTLAFIALSIVVALLAGVLFDALVRRGVLPANPNSQPVGESFSLGLDVKRAFNELHFSWSGLARFLWDGLKESRMVLRWLFVGVLLAAAIRTFVPADVFGDYFGPTVLGLAATLLAATIIEVCSEGSTPIAADIFTRAGAPGNSFTFLMAGVATDYTEIMVIKSVTRSWRIALFLPLLTLPQVVVIGLALNAMV